jgi:hypothetical protein
MKMRMTRKSDPRLHRACSTNQQVIGRQEDGFLGSAVDRDLRRPLSSAKNSSFAFGCDLFATQ